MEHQVESSALLARVFAFLTFRITASVLTPLDNTCEIIFLNFLQTQRIYEGNCVLPRVEVVRKWSSAENPLILKEASIDGIVETSCAGEEPLAAVGREDLNPRLALITEPIGPGACGAVRDDRPEGVVFPGGRGTRKKIAIASG